MRWAQLEGDLVLFAQVNTLGEPAIAQIPKIEVVPVLAIEEQVRLDTVLDHVRGAPLAADQGVVAEVPPEVVVQVLVAAVDLPAALHLEGVMIEHEDTAGTVAVGSAEGTDVNPIRAAVDGVA